MGKNILEKIEEEKVYWHTLEVDEIYAMLDSSKNGLNDEQVEEKLRVYGPNKIEIKERFKILKMILEQFTGFLVVLLIVSGFISLWMGWKSFKSTGDIEEIIDAIAIFAIVIINGIIGFVQDFRSSKALEKLKEYFEQEVLVVRGGQEKKVFSSQLVPGDIILLDNGDKVPADCRIIESNLLKVDEAPLTGESTPVKKIDSVISKKNIELAEKKNMLFMGTSIVYGRCIAIVVATGMDTEMGEIAALTQVKKEMTPLQKSLDKLGKVLGGIILVICGIVMIVDISLMGIEYWVESFEMAVALAISAVPEGLPAAIIITYAIGVSRMAKKKAIISRLPAVETLGSVNYICSDKTGTITRNEMTVKKIWTIDGMVEVGGAGYIAEGKFIRNNRYVKPKEDAVLSKLMDVIYNCNNADVLKEHGKLTVIGDPTEASLVVAAEKAGYSKKDKLKRIFEFFFDSERKRMTTINEKEGKYWALMKGSPLIVLERCTKIQLADQIDDMNNEYKNKIIQANILMASKALRVLGVSYKEVPKDFDREDDISVENDMIFLGLVGMIDPPREGVASAIHECKHAGITTIMITGDQKETALAVAEEVGIFDKDRDEVMGGTEIKEIKEFDLAERIPKIKVFYRMSAMDKLKVVDNLQKLGNVTAVTGDGVNDAPALQKADIGVAMGITGTDVSKEVADMVITDDAFTTIVNAVEEGRNIFENMKKFIRYLLSCNFDEIFTTLTISIIFDKLAFLPLQILLINLTTDALPALALSFDPYDPKLMQMPPRSRKGSFVKDMYRFAFIAGVVAYLDSIITFSTCYTIFGPMIFNGPDAQINILAYAQMMNFIGSLSFELFFVFVARCDNKTKTIKSKPLKNTFLIYSVLISWSLLFMVILIPSLQDIFCGFTTYYLISLRDWVFLLSVILGSIIIFDFFRSYFIDKKELKELREYKKWAEDIFHKHQHILFT
ncbi:MAG: cation-translocating P-type ATPase [Promethearchaeota archaeon]